MISVSEERSLVFIASSVESAQQYCSLLFGAMRVMGQTDYLGLDKADRHRVWITFVNDEDNCLKVFLPNEIPIRLPALKCMFDQSVYVVDNTRAVVKKTEAKMLEWIGSVMV
jgi:hypothetical protein